MTTLPIQRVDSSRSESIEHLGSKRKFWFREGDFRFLFKAEDRGTGEDWAEVVACHLCRLLSIPHVEYKLAAEYQGETFLQPGVVCANMAPPPFSLVLGNQLLLARDAAYPTAQRFKVRQHSIDAVAEVISNLHPPSPEWMAGVPPEITSALGVFVGYVMLDAWIANQDRHHENWAALHDDEMRLAPTYDHGAALARNLTDDERHDRLTTRDRNRTVGSFAERGRSAFYGTPSDSKPLGTLDAFKSFGRIAPTAAAAWVDGLRSVNFDDVWAILESVPTERMSETCKEFTFRLLSTNHQRLLS
jgi:hypothetical protein